MGKVNSKVIKLSFFLLLVNQLQCSDLNYYYNNGEKIYLSKYISIQRDIKNDIDYYQLQDSLYTVGVTKNILVKFKSTNDKEVILKKYDLVLVKELYKNLYMVKVTDKNITLKTANMLHNEISVEYAQPDFVKQQIKR